MSKDQRKKNKNHTQSQTAFPAEPKPISSETLPYSLNREVAKVLVISGVIIAVIFALYFIDKNTNLVSEFSHNIAGLIL